MKSGEDSWMDMTLAVKTIVQIRPVGNFLET